MIKLVLILFSSLLFAKQPEVCKKTLIEAPTFSYVKTWEAASHDNTFRKVKELNGLLVEIVGDYFKAKKYLPADGSMKRLLSDHAKLTHDEAIDSKNLVLKVMSEFEEYYNLKGCAPDFTEILKVAVKEHPQKFDTIRGEMQKFVFTFYKQHLRIPTTREISLKTKVDAELVPIIIGDPEAFWAEGAKENSVHILEARNKMVAAFLRAVQQRFSRDYEKTLRHTPSFDELLVSLVQANTNKFVQADYLQGVFTKDHLASLLNQRSDTFIENGAFKTPVLFKEGIAEIERLAKAQSPGTFKDYQTTTLFTMDRMVKAKESIESKKKFIVTSVVAGIPIVEEMYLTMLKYAEDNDCDIFIMPVNGITEGLDKRLLENPRVHIVTHTIENSKFSLNSIPIMGKNKSPFASLDERGQFIPGQMSIIGSPQLGHRIVPTGSNHIRETAQWSTGCLSQDLFPFVHPAQARTSWLAKNYHRNSFLVVEKADQKAGPFAEGVQNYWHVRPVEFTDNSEYGGTKGFTDLGKKYAVSYNTEGVAEVVISRQDPIALVMGDLHDQVTDQFMMKNYLEAINRFPDLQNIYIHDPIDGFSHNHHEEENYSLLIKKFQSGQLNYHKEMMGLVQTTNALLGMRSNLRVIFPDSNHSYWGNKLIEKAPDSQLVVNGSFLTELSQAKRLYGAKDPLDWVFRSRNRYIENLPANLRQEHETKDVFVSDPNRVQVIPFGVPHVEGPTYRPVHLNFHGHQGASGGKGSLRIHSMANENAVFGDSHKSAILGGAVNVGTSTYLRVGYNDGGYSPWTNSYAYVYPDGSKQLITYSSATCTSSQRPEAGVLSAAQFFGSDALKVLPNDNELVPGGHVMDNHSWWVRLLKGQIQSE